MKPSMTMTAQLSPDLVGEVLLDAQGACKTSLRSGWKPGRMMLTGKRFIFAAGLRVVAEVPLDTVSEVRTEHQAFVLSRRTTIRLTYAATGPKRAAPSVRRLWLMTKDTQAWRDALFQTACMGVTDQDIERVASTVDEDCGTLLRYIWNQQHAGIEELAEVIDAASHDEVLDKIRRRINPAATKLLGCDILTFRHGWKAPGNCEPVNFHWWIAGKRKCDPAAPTVLVDVFEESGHVEVVTDLPGVRDNDVVLSVCNDRLVISAASDTQKFHKETPLPPGTHAETMRWRVNNGVLVVWFRRSLHRQTA